MWMSWTSSRWIYLGKVRISVFTKEKCPPIAIIHTGINNVFYTESLVVFEEALHPHYMHRHPDSLEKPQNVKMKHGIRT